MEKTYNRPKRVYLPTLVELEVRVNQSALGAIEAPVESAPGYATVISWPDLHQHPAGHESDTSSKKNSSDGVLGGDSAKMMAHDEVLNRGGGIVSKSTSSAAGLALDAPRGGGRSSSSSSSSNSTSVAMSMSVTTTVPYERFFTTDGLPFQVFWSASEPFMGSYTTTSNAPSDSIGVSGGRYQPGLGGGVTQPIPPSTFGTGNSGSTLAPAVVGSNIPISGTDAIHAAALPISSAGSTPTVSVAQDDQIPTVAQYNGMVVSYRAAKVNVSVIDTNILVLQEAYQKAQQDFATKYNGMNVDFKIEAKVGTDAPHGAIALIGSYAIKLKNNTGQTKDRLAVMAKAAAVLQAQRDMVEAQEDLGRLNEYLAGIRPQILKANPRAYIIPLN